MVKDELTVVPPRGLRAADTADLAAPTTASDIWMFSAESAACRSTVQKQDSLDSGAARMALRSMRFRSRSSLPRSPNVSQNIYFRGFAVYVT
jgi:hypothetical protein